MGFSAPNHTQVPNQLFDELLPKLKLVELRVLMVIFRKTFGWHKVRDRISLTQLETLTGSGRTKIGKAIRALEGMNLIRKIVEGENGRENTYYELVIEEDSNKNYQCPKDTPPSVQRTPTKETLTKERKKEAASCFKRKTSESAAAPSIEDEIKKNFPKEEQEAALNLYHWKIEKFKKAHSKIALLIKMMKDGDHLKIPDDPKKNSDLAKKIIKTYPDLHKNGEIEIGHDYIFFKYVKNGTEIKFNSMRFRDECVECLKKMRKDTQWVIQL